MSDGRRLALALALLAGACASNAEDGTRLVVTFERAGDTAPKYLLVTWVGDGIVYRQDQRLPGEGKTLPAGPVLGTFQIGVRQPGTSRTIVARAFVGDELVAEGAAKAYAAPDAVTPVSLTLFPGRMSDGDDDGIPDAVDNCPGESNAGQGACANGPADDAGADGGGGGDGEDGGPDLSPVPADATLDPDVVLPDAGSGPDGPPSKLPRGRACLSNEDCETNRCPDARAGRVCASAGMVAVPAGPFLRGCLANDQSCQMDERPTRMIMLKGFEIDQTEVTNAAYDACVQARACMAPPTFNPSGRPLHPVTHATWMMADTYCRWAGKRLPTEAEWEKAARGATGSLYPWGDLAADCTRAQYRGCGLAAAVPVAQLGGVSGYGAEDMAGNVFEWVSDWYSATYFSSTDDTDPTGPGTGTARVRRGGGYDSTVPFLRTGARESGERSPPMTGLRCAKDI